MSNPTPKFLAPGDGTVDLGLAISLDFSLFEVNHDLMSLTRNWSLLKALFFRWMEGFVQLSVICVREAVQTVSSDNLAKEYCW